MINTDTDKLIDLGVTNYPNGFRPHGISLFENETYIKLFVISHYELFERHKIEIFEFHKSNIKLVHIKSLSHVLITHPNDLIAINFNEFLISNDHGKGNMSKISI